MTTFWLLVAVLATNGIDSALHPYQEAYKTKEACTEARVALSIIARQNNMAVVSACLERKAT